MAEMDSMRQRLDNLQHDLPAAAAADPEPAADASGLTGPNTIRMRECMILLIGLRLRNEQIFIGAFAVILFRFCEGSR